MAPCQTLPVFLLAVMVFLALVLEVCQAEPMVSSAKTLSTYQKTYVIAAPRSDLANPVQYLFVVNPGSKTLSMFLIDDNDPWHPTLVGKPADTLGDFPMSVSYSSQIKTACVLNGGAVGGVTCFSADHAKGLTVLDQAPRNVSKALHETTPPAGPPGTASDIVFNPSGTALFATIKGNPGPPAVPGFIYAWPVNLGKVSTEAVINSLPDVILDFSMNFLGSDGRLIITDPSFGASIVNVSPKLTISEDKHVAIPNQGAACWSAYASRFNSAYVIDAGHPNITIVNPASGAIKGVINYNATAKGGFDTAIDRTFMYTLASTPSIVVINLMGSDSGKTPTQLQLLDLSSLGSRQGWQGMAVYPS